MKTYKLIGLLLVSALLGAFLALGVIKHNPVLIFSKGKPIAFLDEEFIGSEEEEFTQKEENLFDDFEDIDEKFKLNLNEYFDDNFFQSEGSFGSMKKFREKLEARIRKDNTLRLDRPFDSWFKKKFGGGSAYDISERENEKNFFYEIKVKDVDSTSIKTKVEDGQVIISGRSFKKTTGDKDSTYLEQSFTRTFPVPPNVVWEKMEMTVEAETDVITLKFPKVP